ncbi:MAG TPA: hypothetical protein P5514_08335 [Bacteroidales bacterium]|nr:hypothetical protein [Bacteroidales bacterium]HRX96937.1 hypothetical protein [Bacteroidales bacterium]
MKMLPKYLTFLFLLLFVFGSAQNVLILEKANKRKLFKFKEGDRIKVYAEPDSIFVSGRIAYLTDSSIYFENSPYEIRISQVQVAYTPRWGFGFLSELFFKGGIGYALVAGANRAISGDQPDLLKYPILIGAGLVATSFLIKPLATHKHKIYDHSWRIAILDFPGMALQKPQ